MLEKADQGMVKWSAHMERIGEKRMIKRISRIRAEGKRLMGYWTLKTQSRRTTLREYKSRQKKDAEPFLTSLKATQ